MAAQTSRPGMDPALVTCPDCGGTFESGSGHACPPVPDWVGAEEAEEDYDEAAWRRASLPERRQ